jgi:Eco57I restriction-modification methylase/TaqI-like C-terminal specificity domain
MAVRTSTSLARQLSFPDMCPVTDAVNSLAGAGTVERGAIFTRREVVDFILNLAGYTEDRPLHKFTLLEPSFGDGDFLLPVIDRLLGAATRCGIIIDYKALASAICGVELHETTFHKTIAKVIERLISHGIPLAQARRLAAGWLHQGDFLLQELPESFDFVVGNPPYVRQELIPDILMAEYRSRYHTIYDRADLYIPFIEHSLSLLKMGGHLGFICADRWMKNRYGGPLRKMVAESFHLKTYVDMVDTPAFHSDVIAYPAITIIARKKGKNTRVVRHPEITASALSNLAEELTSNTSPAINSQVRELDGVAAGTEPWILESFDQLAIVRRLESEFPTLERAGCKVGIGVATGADKSFIGPYDELDVEPDRKLPLVMTRDILNHHVEWRGFGVINPFKEEGGLVDLANYPRLRAYLEARKGKIAKRHIAMKAPANWYRTIDRIYPALARKPKLLIPDIKGEAHIVYEEGRLYPHHNLYFITSNEWNLKALQAVLRSGIARLFVSVYSTRMRGGYLRFQAQYLRRIRLPRWKDVPQSIKKELIAAAEREDASACNKAVFRLYGLSEQERAAIGGNGQ